MADSRDWHRLHAMAWLDFLTGLPFSVDAEVDLTKKKQLLDLLLLRRESLPEDLPADSVRMPDGFENVSEHNLITFKSHRDTLSPWSVDELIAHYVNYRKDVSSDWDNMVPAEQFRLYAVCARRPQWLNRDPRVRSLSETVLEFDSASATVRIIVISGMEQEEQNAHLHLFSADQGQIRYGRDHYRLRSEQTSSFLVQLYDRYVVEGFPMPFDKDEFIRQAKLEVARDPLIIAAVLERLTAAERMGGIPAPQRLEGIPVEQRLEGIPVEQRLEGIPVEQRLEGIPVEQRLEGIPVEQRLEGIPVEQRLEGLSAEERERLLQRLLAERSPPPAGANEGS